ncbi:MULTISPECIES: MFS transporter [unclassified Leptolyngbya]|uniref:MFS transporter n=1 Tax=unclassified Leptolyngbya TaxID=2650499 RepID=UPI001F5488CD|nr:MULTISPECIES: MFS transporter [unclassified Leptolyngbya]
MNSIKSTLSFPAFQSRNYRLFFMGQGLSLVGTWITMVAMIWLVYHLTQSPVLLGVVGFASQVPNLVLVPFGGVLSDRWNHQRTLIVTQALSMLQSFALAILTLTGTIQIWHIIALSLFQGIVNAIDAPTRQAFVPEIVERKENLLNAIALNSSMFNGARLVGPAIGGLLLASVGAGYCFLIDGMSYFAVLLALMAMRLQPKTKANSQESFTLSSVVQHLKEGFAYTFGYPPVRSILTMVALVSFLGVNFVVILPVFSNEILHGNENTLGLLMAASGVGSLIAAAQLSLRREVRGLGLFIAIAPIIYGLGMICFAASRSVWLSALLLAIIGFGSLLQSASSNTVIQTLVPDEMRGRVMSIYIMSFLGMISFGNLFQGALVSWIGAPATVVINGTICVVVAVFYAQQLPRLRRMVWKTHPELAPADNYTRRL